VNKGNPSVLNRIPERPQLPESTRAPFRCGTDKLFLHLPPQLDDFAVSEIPEPRPPLRVPLCSLPSACCLFGLTEHRARGKGGPSSQLSQRRPSLRLCPLICRTADSAPERPRSGPCSGAERGQAVQPNASVLSRLPNSRTAESASGGNSRTLFQITSRSCFAATSGGTGFTAKPPTLCRSWLLGAISMCQW